MAPWNDIDIPEEFGQPLGSGFFARDPREVAVDLIGCVVASLADGDLAAGYIVETEAYLGTDDPGSHAATRGITKRNAVMYGAPGTAYVYFTYGNHHMLNLVCVTKGMAGAVLVRALEPPAASKSCRTAAAAEKRWSSAMARASSRRHLGSTSPTTESFSAPVGSKCMLADGCAEPRCRVRAG